MAQADNCSICGLEFEKDKLHPIAISAINITKFKICNNCLNKCDPEEDYKEVKQIVLAFLNSK